MWLPRSRFDQTDSVMAIESTSALLDVLRANRLLSDVQMREAERSSEHFPAPGALADDLVDRGWLTRHQAKQVLRGRAADLTIGDYRVLERLGEGGMGRVYKALHRPTNRVAALKVMKPHLLADPVALKRFRREVTAASQLSHPNIAAVFEALQAEDAHFLAMEFVDGTDLTNLVNDGGPVSVSAACEFIRQAALGLGHAHERGLVHRDVKPSNLLVTRSQPAGVVKILDLGLARPLSIEDGGHQHVSTLTVDGAVVGTPDFMAPEQGKNSHTADFRADLYSLGCTLYYLLTARLPFPEGTVIDKLVKHQLEDPYPVELIRQDVPAAILPVLQRLMAKKPDDRYQSGAEVAAALSPFCTGLDGPAVVFTTPPSPVAAPSTETTAVETSPPESTTFRFDAVERETPPAKSKRRVVVFAVLAAVLVVVLGIVVVIVAN
jgi:serine/threonine-protein kinase